MDINQSLWRPGGSYSFPKVLHHYKGSSPQSLRILTPLIVFHHTTIPCPHVASIFLPRVLRVLGVLHWWSKRGELFLCNICYSDHVLNVQINDFFFFYNLQFNQLQSQRLAQVSLNGRQRVITANCLTWVVGAGRRGCFRRDHLFRNSPDSFRPLYHEGVWGGESWNNSVTWPKLSFQFLFSFTFTLRYDKSSTVQEKMSFCFWLLSLSLVVNIAFQSSPTIICTPAVEKVRGWVRKVLTFVWRGELF